MKTRLEAKVECRNMINAAANSLALILHANFNSLVGKQVTRVDGCLIAKYDKLIPTELGNGMYLRKLVSDYSLGWTVHGCVEAEHRANYDEVTVYVGKLTDGVLTELVDFEELRTNFTVQEIAAARKDVERAEEELRKAKSKLDGFEMFDA